MDRVDSARLTAGTGGKFKLTVNQRSIPLHHFCHDQLLSNPSQHVIQFIFALPGSSSIVSLSYLSPSLFHFFFKSIVCAFVTVTSIISYSWRMMSSLLFEPLRAPSLQRKTRQICVLCKTHDWMR